MNDDGELLRKFAENHDQASFEILVRRYIGFVHAVSLRRLRDSHAAEDATQEVFVALARKAATVARAPSVMGWLHRSACYETLNHMRARSNRIARETEAAKLGMLKSQSVAEPGALEAVLDEALGRLPEPDRNVLLARFFSGHSYAQIGETLRLTENAARMRVDRALDKLRHRLLGKGITCSAAALGAGLPACASAPVPSAVVAAVTNAALVGLTASTSAAGIFALMSTSKIIVGTVAAVAVAGFCFQSYRVAGLKERIAEMQAEHASALEQARKQDQRATSVSASTDVKPQAALSNAAVASSRDSGPGITTIAPTGWTQNGSAVEEYTVGVDETQLWGGLPSAYAESKGEVTGKFGGMMQSISAATYRGQRVRLTGWIKTENAERGAHLWMRVDSETGKMIAFDNMKGRAPKGTADWEEYSVVLDVAENAGKLNYGFFVSGKGKMWVNGVTITPVGEEVPTTNMMQPQPSAPVNLGFKALAN